MGIISKNDRQIKLYYHSENSIGKQLVGYVTSAEKNVLLIDLSKTNVPGTQWKELADMLDDDIQQLIDTDHPDFKQLYGEDLEMEDHDWLKVLDKHPQLLRYPVVLIGDKAHTIETPSAFVSYIDPDSAGLEKPYNK